eukprot:CAMPEP_0119413136 /NCGR_PEP_ID=MMETSP1335-20130426/5323_1 /TAXON_ID=259385 /ORGANISM="Chrysoculter rhomboideus, Strain RCC1486" /LENGTH=193 /DNA_ID=CAMNT_0007437915 /DNA_START=272 /DNA_END=854 /DNA_ORIENTATION=-
MLRLERRCNLCLPPVTVVQELVLVVEQLLVCLRRILVIRALNDRVDWTGLLAEAAEDAFGHVNVVACRASRAILTHLRLNGDSLRRADGLTELASNAPFLACWVSPECVLATEARAQWPLLEGVVDGDLLPEEHRESEAHTTQDLRDEERLCCPVQDILPGRGAISEIFGMRGSRCGEADERTAGAAWKARAK